MNWRLRSGGLVAGFFLLALAAPAQAFTLVEDRFDVNVSTVSSTKPQITNVYFYRGYTDLGGMTAGQITPGPNLNWGADNSLIGLLLPAVQKVREAATMVGLCDGSVLIGITDGTATPIIGNANFNFQATFGVTEASLIGALQDGNTNAIIGVLDNAYVAGILPYIETRHAGGTFVNFSTPSLAGNFTVNEVPEPATAALLLPMTTLPLLRRRR